MIRAAARLALAFWAAACLAGALWGLAQNPLAAPFVDRSLTEARAVLTWAMAREATPDWLLPRLSAAIAADDPDEVALLRDIGRDHAIPIPPDLAAEAEALIARHDSLQAQAGACLQCMADISTCPSLTLVAVCALPFELSPAGDVAALGRQGANLATGQDFDGIEAGLAAVGLAATLVAIPSLGTSVPVKIGASVLRVARKARALSPGMTGALRLAARDGGRIERLTAFASDATRIAAQTSPAEALRVLRLADSPAELRRLARLADAAGPDTRKALAVLGKARSLRMLHRLSDLAVMTAGFLLSIAAQTGTLIGAILKLMLRRALRRPPPRRLPPGLRTRPGPG